MRDVYDLAAAPVYDFNDTERAALETVRRDFSHSECALQLKIHPGKDGVVAQYFRNKETNFSYMLCKRPIEDGLIYDLYMMGQPKQEFFTFANAIIECRRFMGEVQVPKVVSLRDYIRN